MARVRRAVATAVDRHAVIREREAIVVACSGGPDSSALLDALARLAPPRGWRLHVVHVDHGIRRNTAVEAALVARRARALDLPFEVARVMVPAGPSLQERARVARAGALRAAAARCGATAIALGHTADDQAETVLMRALTSATPRSLLAMAEREGPLARPLLHVWRDHILAYCAALGIETVDDPSNRDRRFLRSRVRHDVMPQLEQVFPGARRRLVRLAQRQRLLAESEGRPPGPW